MTSSKGASPSDNKSAAQAAVEKAQAVASGIMRMPLTSVQIAAQLPDLLENLAVATERLNTAIERAEKYTALSDSMVGTMQRLLPQLEALVATGNDAFKELSSIPGASTLGRLVSRRSSGEGEGDDPNDAGHRAKD